MELRKDGSKPVEVDRRPYRPKLESVYEEPEYYPEDDGLEILYRDSGKALYQETEQLPPRDDIITFGPDKQEELDRNLQWGDCPEEFKQQILDIVMEYWDVFDNDGMKRPIRNFVANIDTGTCKPVCCKPPHYGPHETKIMEQLVDGLERNGLIEDDDGPWGALIVLAAKANQSHKHWSEYIWRLCVSYRQLNAVTRVFAFLSPRCDDAVNWLGNAKYCIVMDLAWGYWQVPMHPNSRPKTAFFVPGGKKRWTRMPMGWINSMAIFNAMMAKLSKKWGANFDVKHKIDSRTTIVPETGTKQIVDDVLLFSDWPEMLLEYF